jgi:hypothetical protein
MSHRTAILRGIGALLLVAPSAGCRKECVCFLEGEPRLALAFVDGGTVKASSPNPCEIDVDFGALPVGQGASATATIQIENVGSGALDIAQVNPNLDPEFGLTYGDPQPIQPAEFGEVTVAFQPYRAGQVQSTFTIQTDGLNEQCPSPVEGESGDVLVVMLTGSGSS